VLLWRAGGKNAPYPAGGISHRADVRRAIQFFTAALRKRQISEYQDEKKEDHPAMQVCPSRQKISPT